VTDIRGTTTLTPGLNQDDGSGWPGLFWEAFRRSRNPMVLLDERRRHIEVNGAYVGLVGFSRGSLTGRPIYEIVPGGPIMSAREWQSLLRQKHFTGDAELICQDGSRVMVQFAGHPEMVTGRRLVLFVAVRTARRARRSYPQAAPPPAATALTKRQLEVAGLIALGLSGPEIAQELTLSHDTVRTHVRNAMRNVGARSRAQLVAITLGDGAALASAG
jgi:PAS domain S-box-containing protein